MHKRVESGRTKNLEGSVTIVNRLVAGLQYSLASILGRRRDFPLCTVSIPVLCPTQPPIEWVRGTCCLKVKRMVCGIDNRPP
jgi:hypothetical protein